jgi:hypothetical protein
LGVKTGCAQFAFGGFRGNASSGAIRKGRTAQEQRESAEGQKEQKNTAKLLHALRIHFAATFIATKKNVVQKTKDYVRQPGLASGLYIGQEKKRSERALLLCRPQQSRALIGASMSTCGSSLL